VSLGQDDARLILQTAARNAAGGDTSAYADPDLDQAISLATDDFLLRTQATQRVDVLAVTAGSTAVSPPNGCNPFRAMKLWNPGFERPEFIDVGSLMDKAAERHNIGRVGRPEFIAFDSPTSMVVFPIPDINYSMALLWWQQFQYGLLPDDLLRNVVATAAVYKLQSNEKENREAIKAKWDEYLDFVNRVISAGSLHAQASLRSRLED
jgi:hypothetical protein